MKMRNKIVLLGGLLFSVAAPLTIAKTVYVDDKIKIWSRTGPSNEYKVKYQIEPGEALDVLQTDQETGFFEVRDSRGRDFWVDGKFISTEPTAHQKLVIAEKEIKRLKAEHSEKVSGLQQKINQMEPLQKMNADLQKQVAKLQTEVEQSRQKAQLYEGGFNRDAFFGGAAVLLGGMFIGWIFSKFGGRKRNAGWN